MNRAVIVIAGLVVCATGLISARQAPPQGQPPAATAVISGTLTSADLAAPVRKAQVRLISGTKTVRTTTTDAEGRYAFTAVPAGDYTLAAARPGYLEMVRGARRPGPTSAGTVIAVAAGQKQDDVSWTLPRASVITGTVLDEFGDPAFNVPVRGMRFVYENGFRTLTSGGNTVTDDRGVYRLAALTPGEYLVAAVPRDNVAAASAQAEAIRDRLAQIAAAAKAAGRSETSNAVAPAPPGRVGYVPVYFPGTPLGASAGTVRVGISEEVAGIDIRLQLVETVTISGRLTSAEGVPTSRMHLVDTTMPMSLVGIWFRDARADGSFAFPGVVPGSYSVKAWGTPGGPKGSAEGEMWAGADVTADARGASDVMLTMQRGVTVSGRLALDNLPAGFDRTRVRLSLYPVSGPSDWEMPVIELPLDADGRFSKPNLLPGRFRFRLQNLPQDWALASAMFGDRDAADHHLTIDGSRHLTGELALTSRTAEVTGMVATADGKPAPDHSVLIFPADRALWIPQSRRIHIVQPGADGRFVLRGLPPGDYRAATALDPEPGRHFDPEYLAQLAAVSVGVTLEAGATRAVDLRAR